jgi:hypothetical protein
VLGWEAQNEALRSAQAEAEAAAVDAPARRVRGGVQPPPAPAASHAPGVDGAAQQSLVNAAVDLMRILTPVAERLTTLPANPDQRRARRSNPTAT